MVQSTRAGASYGFGMRVFSIVSIASLTAFALFYLYLLAIR